jgi:hypothetical protein
MTSTRASSLALAGALLLVALLAGLGVAALRNATPDRSPAAAVKAATKLRETRAAAAAEAQRETFDVPFAPAMVRDERPWRMSGQPKTFDVTVVNATPGADLEQTANGCLDEYRGKGGAAKVQCYVFASQEAYEALNQTDDLLNTPGVDQGTIPVSAQCWVIYAVQTGSKEPTISDMRQAGNIWESRGCPASWKGEAGAGQ